MRRVRAAAATAMACLLVGACGQAGDRTGPTPTGPASAGAASTSPAPASPEPASPVPASPAPATPPASLGVPPGQTAGPAKPVTVTGTVEEGVEGGCLVLNGYLLLGGRDQGLRAGARVTVTGRTQPDVMTTCQQGTPLLVENVRPG